MARKTWVLDTDTKGTGAHMVPLDEVQKRAQPPRETGRRGAAPVRKPATGERPKRVGRAESPAETTSTALPPGHVRKRSTGEIGKVQAVDPKGGTATVRWLKGGATSTVALSAISRR